MYNFKSLKTSGKCLTNEQKFRILMLSLRMLGTVNK